MSKEHEVTRVALDSSGCNLNQAESELSGTGRKKKRQPGERQSNPELFERLDTKRGDLTKNISLFIIARRSMKMLIGKEGASRLKLHPQTVYRWYMLAN